MKEYITQVVPATTREVLLKHTCDLCGADLVERMSEIKEAEIRIKTGESYPEGGRATELSADVCVGCIRIKVFPFLEKLGAAIYEKEIDW